MNGLHILARVRLSSDFEAREPGFYLERAKHIITQADLTIVGEVLVEFGNNAFTLAVMLAESHMTMHTWYEKGYVDLDIYGCGVTKDSSQSVREAFDGIVALFEPIWIEDRHDIKR